MAPTREQVDFSLRGPVAVSLDDEQLTSPGCSVIDLIFGSPTQVGELVFRNYYTGWISIVVRSSSPSSQDAEDGRFDRGKHISPWTISVERKTLMCHPHQEVGSQDYVSILATESVAPWIGLTTMRLILRQPSPSWRTFLVEEVSVFRDLPRRLSRLSLSAPQSPAEYPVSQKETRAKDRGDIRTGECSQRFLDGNVFATNTRNALLWTASVARPGSWNVSQSKPPVNVGYEIVGLPQI